VLGLEVLIHVSVVVLHIYSAVRMDARHLAFVVPARCERVAARAEGRRSEDTASVLGRRLASEPRLAFIALAELPPALRAPRPVRRRRARPIAALLLRATIVALRPAAAAALRPRHRDELLVHVGLDLAVVILDRESAIMMRLLDDAVVFLRAALVPGAHLVADAHLGLIAIRTVVAGAHVLGVNTTRLLAVRRVDVKSPVLVRALDLALHPFRFYFDLDAVALAILRLGLFGLADLLRGHVALAFTILHFNVVGAVGVGLPNLAGAPRPAADFSVDLVPLPE